MQFKNIAALVLGIAISGVVATPEPEVCVAQVSIYLPLLTIL